MVQKWRDPQLGGRIPAPFLENSWMTHPLFIIYSGNNHKNTQPAVHTAALLMELPFFCFFTSLINLLSLYELALSSFLLEIQQHSCRVTCQSSRTEKWSTQGLVKIIYHWLGVIPSTLGVCNPSDLGGWGRRIAWTQEMEVAVSRDRTIALQPTQREQNFVSK